MAERNTRIRGGQIKSDTVDPSDLNATNSPSDNQVPTYDTATQEFTWETPSSGSSFISGMIIIWSGSIASIPSGWVLCDGNNSTPDIRDKFIVGAKQDDSGVAKTNITGALTKSGGSITISANNLPVHTHAVGTLAAANEDAHTHLTNVHSPGTGNYAEKLSAATTAGAEITSEPGSAHGHTISGASGNNTTTASAYTQPYFALAFIMKT
jgi:hypothetical protein